MDDLSKQTNFSGGISTGGGDSGSDVIPMAARFGLRLNAATMTGVVVLPPNTKIRSTVIMPLGDIAGQNSDVPHSKAPTAGTVSIGTQGAPKKYLADGAVTADAMADAADQELLVASTEIYFTGVDIDGDVVVALEVTPLDIRQ